MTIDSNLRITGVRGRAPASEVIRANDRVVKRLGRWTSARRFDVKASHARVVLDLLLPPIDPGDIEVELDIDRATVTLLVPDGANVVDDELRRVGRGRVKDRTGNPASGGRRIKTPRRTVPFRGSGAQGRGRNPLSAGLANEPRRSSPGPP